MAGKRNFLFVLLLLSVWSNKVWAQCGPESITTSNWCENSFAKWTFNNPTPNARYLWYSYTPTYTAADIDAEGRLIKTGTVFYDSTTSSTFYSPFRVTTAGIAPNTSVRFTYIKKVDYKAVPTPAATPAYVAGPSGGTFEMNFSNSMPVRFNSVRVPVVLNNPGQLYKIQVSFGSTTGPGSSVYTFSSVSGTPIPGVTNGYYIDVPVNYTLTTTGATKLVINTNPTGGGSAIAVNNLLYAPSQVPASNIGPISNVSASNSAPGYSAIYDWNFTAICPPQHVAESFKETTAGVCCVVPSSINILTLSPDKTSIVNNGPDNVTLTVGSYASASNYFAWYLDGVAVPAASGTGKISYSSNKTGTWEVREISAGTSVTDRDNPSCYSDFFVLISDKKIFASIVKAPTTSPLCIGDKWDLSGTGSANLAWSTGGGTLSNATGPTTTFTATKLGMTKITLTGDVVSGNVVVNGDFSAGTSGITTQFNNAGDPRNVDGAIGVANSAGFWGTQADWNAGGLYTYATGNPGNFLVVNGGADGTKQSLVWGQKVTVQAGKTYNFSLDLTSVTYIVSDNMASGYGNAPAVAPFRDVLLDVLVNGVKVGQASTNFAANGGIAAVGKWKTFTFPWTAGATVNSATLEIRQVSPTVSQPRGYDYGIDNISFGGQESQEDEIVVGPITDCSSIIATASPCIQDSLTDLTATVAGGLIFDHWELTSAPGVSVSTNNPYRVKTPAAVSYTAVGYMAVGNVLANGDFNQGPTGFLSGSPYYDPIATYGDSKYNVTANTSSGNSFWSNLPQAPGEPAGSLRYVVDAKGPVGRKVVGWTFTGAIGDKFAFSGYVANQHTEFAKTTPDTVNSGTPAKIGIFIDGSLVAVGNTGANQNWIKMTANWTATTGGTHTLEVRDLKGTSGPGNDFVLDGFVLAPAVGFVKTATVVTPVCDPCVNKATINEHTYCGNSGYVSLNLHSSESPGVIYSWYDKSVNPSKLLGTTEGSLKDTIDLTGIAADASGNKTVYYTKSAKGMGTVFKKAQSCDAQFDDAWENLNPGSKYPYQSQFTNTTPIKITSLSINLKSELYNTGDVKSATISYSIVGSKPATNGGGKDADLTKVYGTFTTNWTRTKGAEAQVKIETLVLTGSTTTLPVGDFFIVQNNNVISGNGNISVGRSDCNQGVVWDDFNGTTVSRSGGSDGYGTGGQSKSGMVFDVKFEIPAAPCPRTPVTLTENCPCSPPKTVIVNKAFDNDTIMCAGSNLTITGEYTLNAATPPQKGYKYSWYKKVGTTITVITAPTAVTTSPVTLTLNNITVADNATYFFKVDDGDGLTSNKSCYLQDSLTLTVNVPNTAVTPTANQIICSGTKPVAFTTPVAAGGTGAGKYQWFVNGKKITGSTGNGQNYTFATPADTVFNNTSALDKVYTYIRRDSSGVCPAVNSNPVTITVMPVLKPGTISASQIICKGTAPAALTQTLPTGGSGTYTYQWLSSKIPAGPFVNVAGGTGATTNLYVPPVLTDSIYYTRRVTSTSGGTTCSAVYSDTIKIAMVSPVIAGTVSLTQTICYNTKPTDLSSTAHKGGLKSGDSYTYQWQTLPDKANPVTGWVNSFTTPGYAFSANLTDTTKYRLIVKGSCSAEGDTSNEVTIIVRPDLLPGSIAGGATICSGANPADITNLKLPFGGANAPADWNYRWLVSVNGGAYSADAGSTNTSGFVINSLTNTTSSPVTYEYKREVKSLECNTTAESNVVKYTVTPGIIPGTISSDQTICKGATPAAFTNTPATGGSGTYAYEWQESSNNIAFSPALGGSGANTALYTPPAAVNAEVYYRRKVSSGACPDQYSDTIKISLVPDMIAAVISANQTICYNTSAANIAISSPPTGGLKSGDSYSYRWESLADASGSTWAGPIGITAGYAPGTLTDTMQYRLVVTGSCGAASTTSNVVKVTVLPDLKGGTIVGGGTVCSGEDPADIANQVSPTGANGTADYNYSWQVTANSITSPAIPGGASYVVPAFPANTGTTAMIYTVKRIVSSTLCPSPTAESNVVTYTVNPTVKPGTIGDDQTLCSGNTINALTEKTPPTGGDGNYNYQWQYSLTGTAGSFVNVTPAATGSSFTPVPQASTIYFARLENSPGCQSVLSNPVKITILPGILAGSIGSDQDICSGSYADTIKTKTLPSNVSSAASSVWKISTSSASGPWSNAPAQLVPSDVVYKYPGSLTAGTIWIIKDVTDPNGPPLCNTAQTAPVKIVTRAPLTGGQIGSNQTICENGDPAAFAELVTPTGGKDDVAYKYSWQYSTNGTTWNPISNSTNAVFDPGVLTITTSYRRVVNDVLGCGPRNSNEVTITVTPNSNPSVSIVPPGQVCLGSTVSFQATPVAGGTTPVYEWTVNGITAGTNSDQFTSATLNDGDKVQVKLKSSETCIAPGKQEVFSNIALAQMLSNITPDIKLVAQDPICKGTVTTFTPTYNTLPSVYEWYLNGTLLSLPLNSATYSGTFNNGDEIYVKMTSPLTCVTTPYGTSNTVKMAVLDVPQPNIVESDATFCSGDDTTYTAVIGTGTTFKWFKDGLPLSNTTLSLIVNQPGKYTLQEDNGVCPRFSDTVTVTVIPTPVANAGSDIYVLENTVVTLNGSGGDLYSWSPATGLNFTDIPNPTFTATDNTIYVLTVADATNTCSSTDEVEVFVERPVKIPNAFTPNKDGNNDTWEIENINGFPNVTFEVYNRWGTLVWKWTGNLKQWDGTNYRNGEVLPDGTYFYVIDLHSVIFKEPYSGYVQILK
ncbi:gliding motility-associated C-terminal domain-containing protein [Sporocytophaga myxococcoides]|uniref:gliding motility-associated C-terminal domain-containing protein n=1 Tax=Sporocytophaga myxococcoides TaxID=153721 RepID=UPI0003F5BBBD|nr:T9SS C-terminal target domain-containing protein [Sporocytophaga myxococcoides]